MLSGSRACALGSARVWLMVLAHDITRSMQILLYKDYHL